MKSLTQYILEGQIDGLKMYRLLDITQQEVH